MISRKDKGWEDLSPTNGHAFLTLDNSVHKSKRFMVSNKNRKIADNLITVCNNNESMDWLAISI